MCCAMCCRRRAHSISPATDAPIGGLSGQHVRDAAVVQLLRVDHGDIAEPAVVAELPAGLRIEGRAIEDHGDLAADLGMADHLGIEAAKRCVLVIQAAGHARCLSRRAPPPRCVIRARCDPRVVAALERHAV